MCIHHIKEGSPVVSNLLRQLSVTDRLTHCWSHGLWETERLAFFLSPKSRLPFPLRAGLYKIRSISFGALSYHAGNQEYL